MLKLVADFFSNKMTISDDETQEAKDHHIEIATCALLIEIASIDEAFDEDEKELIIRHFKNNFGLTDDEINELFELSNKELKERIDLWGFTNLINQRYSTDQKLKVIELIWQVIYADGELTAHEDYLVHKLYKMLNLTHKQMIDVKMKVLERGK